MNTPDVEVSLTLSYKKVVAHNFGLVQDAARKLGNIPEVRIGYEISLDEVKRGTSLKSQNRIKE